MNHLRRTAVTVLALIGGLELAAAGPAQAAGPTQASGSAPTTGSARPDGPRTADGHLLPTTGSFSVPITAQGNAIGTALGQLDLPPVHTEVSTVPLTHTLRPLYGRLYIASMPLHPPWPTADHPDPEHVGGFAHLDHEQVNSTAPVNISGNALALGGPAHADSEGAQATGEAPSPVRTSGYGGFVSGNQVAVDAALPLSVSGNTAGVLGDAASSGDTHTSARTGGNTSTEGDRGFGSGNVLAAPLAARPHITGNNLSLLGTACSTGHHSEESQAGGNNTSSRGTDPLSGNILAPPEH